LKQVDKLYTDNVYETEQAVDGYLAAHPGAPLKTLRDILLTGKVVPSRTTRLITNIGKTTSDPGNLTVIQRREELRLTVLKMMADLRVDAIVHATFDYPPGKIPTDALTIADPAGRRRSGQQPPPRAAHWVSGALGARRIHSRRVARGYRVPGPPVFGRKTAHPWLRLRAGHTSPPTSG
jgi:hypothetical protein